MKNVDMFQHEPVSNYEITKTKIENIFEQPQLPYVTEHRNRI